MLGIEITYNANKHLNDILEYSYLHWGFERTEKYLSNLYDTIQLLSETPFIAIQHDKKKKDTPFSR